MACFLSFPHLNTITIPDAGQAEYSLHLFTLQFVILLTPIFGFRRRTGQRGAGSSPETG